MHNVHREEMKEKRRRKQSCNTFNLVESWGGEKFLRSMYAQGLNTSEIAQNLGIKAGLLNLINSKYGIKFTGRTKAHKYVDTRRDLKLINKELGIPKILKRLRSKREKIIKVKPPSWNRRKC